ncbi:helix-turn-helix transcriptional regulator [Streptomyces sp. SID3343]|uniref:Scr1 family TA system antitoxin-like transcriptional regulator n=1 Tax=Streptomyces sp. SID3343 TaxID=2690260 RepID=UPI00136CFFA3|nr:helix-turn-helix domain-containing protein [Streptomyces sp. SID3343]
MSARACYGFELRRLREKAGLTQTALGNHVKCSGSYIGQLETAERGPKPDITEFFERALGADGTLQRLCGLALKEEAQPPSWLRDLLDAEAGAVRIRVFEVDVIPGLLQAPGYATHLFKAGEPLDVEARPIEDRVATRMGRQDILVGPNRTELWAVVDEVALMRLKAIPDKDVVAEQFDHLVKRAELPNVTLQLLLVEAGVHACSATPVTLLSHPEREEYAYVETMGSGDLICDLDAVRECERRYDYLRTKTLSPAQSLAWIRAQQMELHP